MCGVVLYIGSMIVDFVLFEVVFMCFGMLIVDLCVVGYSVIYVDFGGGLGVFYKFSDSFFSL